MKTLLRKFRSSEDGAVTVDWVVLTAAVCALAGAVMVSLYTSTENVGDGVGGFMADFEVGG